MVSKKLSEVVQKFYLSGRLDEDFVMDAVKHTLGGEVERSTKYEDINKHVDFWWDSPRKGRIGIDVKGVKKNSRSDNTNDDTIHWLELDNVQGKNGWLKGNAEYIAFRTFTNILFVKRDRLLSFTLECVKNKDVVNYNPNECYVPYRRKGRLDLIVKVKTSDLLKLADFAIEYD